MSDSKQISWETMRYYGEVRELLKVSGEYSWARSLKENLLDPAMLAKHTYENFL